MRGSHNNELAHLKKERDRRGKKTKHFGPFAAFWFGTFVMLFHTTRGLVGHEKTPKDGWYIKNAYKYTVFENSSKVAQSYWTIPCHYIIGRNII